MSAAPLITVKAGRSLRRDEPSRIVEPQGARGLLYVIEEDGLMHFCWKDGASSAIVDDLIIFPGDASFLPVQQSPRTYVLKFSSSSARHFFWMQNTDASQDAENARKINELIQAPEEDNADAPAGDVTMEGTRSAPEPAATSSTQPSTSTPSNVDQFAAIMAQFAAQQGQSASGDFEDQAAYTLPDILTPQSVLPLLSDSKVRENLYQYLPSGLEHNQETLRQIVNSTELKRSLASLDSALRTGALHPLVMSLGLEADAALGVDNFLKAIQKKAENERSSDAMQLE